MKIENDEYRCYGFEVIPNDDTINDFKSLQEKSLLEETKQEISFFGVSDMGNSVLFMFADNESCKKYMNYYSTFLNVRYVGECAIKKNNI